MLSEKYQGEQKELDEKILVHEKEAAHGNKAFLRGGGKSCMINEEDVLPVCLPFIQAGRAKGQNSLPRFSLPPKGADAGRPFGKAGAEEHA